MMCPVNFRALMNAGAGLGYRHGFYAATLGKGMSFNAIIHQDHTTGKRTDYLLDEGDSISEPVFVPRSSDSAEGDGYLLSIIYRAAQKRSDLAFFDATQLDQGPFALAELSTRVPNGFHGNWRSLA